VPMQASADPFIVNTDYQHTAVTFSYEKSWDESAKFYHLRPDNVYFGLYRRYEGETNEEPVTQFTETVTSDKVSGTTKGVTTPLPAWLTGGTISLPLAAGTLV
ncbi:MAG TPA: hypothetical protein DEO95_01710, partial [Ruminococcaceae bacterium]|nr:hypothetical protein [Oscillospiraceae bacterium]